MLKPIENKLKPTQCHFVSIVVVNVESMNKFKENLDHYLRDNSGFKQVMLTLSSLEPLHGAECSRSAMVLGKH